MLLSMKGGNAMFCNVKINGENAILTVNKSGVISIIDKTTNSIWESSSPGIGISLLNKYGKLTNVKGVSIIECRVERSRAILSVAVIDTENTTCNKSTRDPSNSPLDNPTSGPTSKAVNDLVNRAIDPINKTTNKTTNNSVNETINKILNESINKTLNIRISLEIDLSPEYVLFKVCAVNGLEKGQIIGIDFPAGLGKGRAGDEGYLVMPCGVGVMCDYSPCRNPLRFEKLIYSGGQVGYSMPLFGIVKKGNVLAGIVRTPFDCILRTWINDGDKGEYSITPCWVFEEGRLDYPREVSYYMPEKGGYLEVAKTYKGYLIKEGKYKSFKEKVDESPIAANLVGASLAERFAQLSEHRKSKISRRTHITIRELYEAAKEKGLERVVSYFMGLWQRAYIEDCMSPEYGTVEELKAVADYARSLSKGYIVSVYENLLDLFETNPNWNEDILVKNRDGSLRKNWYVAREDAWTHTVCPYERINIAKKELPKLKDIIGEGSVYMDVEGAMGLMECFAVNHPATREDDCKYRRELLTVTRRIFGSVATEAVPIDCLADVVDVGAYFPIYQFIGDGPWCSYETRLWPPVIPIPLFQLVYHGSLINMNPSKGGYYAGDPPYTPLYGMLPDTIDEFALRISHGMGDNAYHDMLEHRFLTEPNIELREEGFKSRDVQMSTFSDGTTVISNFSKQPYTYMGKQISGNDFIIIKE